MRVSTASPSWLRPLKGAGPATACLALGAVVQVATLLLLVFAGGPVGVVAAARWVAGNLPLFALNVILVTPGELWALRYPDTHELYVLERPAGGHHGARHLDHTGRHGRLRVHSEALAGSPSVVVASERMDENPHWRLLAPGELLHVGPELGTTSRIALPDPPAHPLTLADLRPDAAASQRPV